MDGIRCHKYITIIITVQRLLLEKETEDFRFFTNLYPIRRILKQIFQGKLITYIVALNAQPRFTLQYTLNK